MPTPRWPCYILTLIDQFSSTWIHRSAIVASRIYTVGLQLRFLRSDGFFVSRIYTGPKSANLAQVRNFPGNPIVYARRDFSRWPHRPCWVRGRNSDLGLVIDIAQLLLSKCAHAWNVLARWPNAKPVRTAKTTQPWLSPAGGGIRW